MNETQNEMTISFMACDLVTLVDMADEAMDKIAALRFATISAIAAQRETEAWFQRYLRGPFTFL